MGKIIDGLVYINSSILGAVSASGAVAWYLLYSPFFLIEKTRRFPDE